MDTNTIIFFILAVGVGLPALIFASLQDKKSKKATVRPAEQAKAKRLVVPLLALGLLAWAAGLLFAFVF